jgi:hypothetical protein
MSNAEQAAAATMRNQTVPVFRYGSTEYAVCPQQDASSSGGTLLKKFGQAHHLPNSAKRVPMGFRPPDTIPAHEEQNPATNYITRAIFSSSCCNDSTEQPAPPTLAAASQAACGDTP